MADDKSPIAPTPLKTGAPLGLGILIFGFGTAAGFLIAFSGLGFLENSAGLIVIVFLAALFVVGLLAAVALIARRPLTRRLFGVAEAHVEHFADPLARIAERAIDRDPTGATAAARDLVTLVLARYAWISVRRWVIAALTALIAAMAALAGTALLFKQNQLLAIQSDLLREQNGRIVEQTVLLDQQVELAEAERNSALAVEITQIAALLGAVADTSLAGQGLNTINTLDTTELNRALVLRVTSVSRALKPYRFLDTGMRAGDPSDRMRIAMQRRRDDLGDTFDRMATYYGWQDPQTTTRLIDRPASPERGQLLNVLVTGGIRNLETLSTAGLDLSYAWLPEVDMGVFTAQTIRLPYADFTGSYLADVDFGGASLENARFVRANIRDTDFSTLEADRVKPPLRAADAPFRTFMTGADFGDAMIADTRFGGVWLSAANFDGAILLRCSLAGADLSVATLRGTILLDTDLTGASLKSTDLEGAIVFGADFLDQLEKIAEPGSFVRDRWAQDPIDVAEIMAMPLANNSLEPADIDAAMVRGDPYRLRRIGDWNTAPPTP